MTTKTATLAILVLMAALFPAHSSAQSCNGFTGAHVQYIGVGSSVQFNTFAFAAENLLASAGNGVNFWSEKSFALLDNRINVVDSVPVWVAWDNAADCVVYAYFSADSTVGVKSFFAYQKQSNSFFLNYDTAAVFGQAGQTFPACSLTTAPNAGQPLCTSATLPSTLQVFFTTQPHPISSTAPGKNPLPYCGQGGLANPETGKWCFFNAAHSDLRPEDSLYATTRALGVYNGLVGLTGLGYGNSVCGAVGTSLGCKVFESFGQGGKSNVLKFALTGNDPFSAPGAPVPTYTTVSIGAAPVVVFVNDADSSGFGTGAPSNYAFTDINHKILAGYEDGTFSCTGDASPSLSGAGNPVQVVQREPHSGVYNAFEYTTVRTLSGSAAMAINEGSVSAIRWFTDDDSGQELNNDPASNFNTPGCPATGATVPTTSCGDPLYEPTNVCGAGTTKGLKLRAIGPGEMVAATLCQEPSQNCTVPSPTGVSTPDGLGYAFWGYRDFAPAATGCATNSGSVTCSAYLGHYLTVDSVDPLFTNPGDSTNPNGAYHLPQCYLSGGSPSCFAPPFTHIYDGTYPLWTILRATTFDTNVSGQVTPAGVLNIVAQAENVADGSTPVSLADFVPFFKNITAGNPNTGDLNLGVFRSHFKQTASAVNPVNGYAACTSFTGISISGLAGACTVDAGADMGGSVFTVQSDVDFHADFGSLASNPAEIFALHQ